MPQPALFPTPKGNGAPSPQLSHSAHLSGSKIPGQSRDDVTPGRSPNPNRGKSADLLASRSLAGWRADAPQLPAWPEGSPRRKHRSSTRSSAAGRGVCQRVLILSRPQRSNWVLGRRRHPALPARPACPTGALACRFPGTSESASAALSQSDQHVLGLKAGRGRAVGVGCDRRRDDDAQRALRTCDPRDQRGAGKLVCS